METKFIEAVSSAGNWGKFMVARFTAEEWLHVAFEDYPRSLLATVGWGLDHYLILDLQTGEGSIFRPGGHAHNDLEKHAIWVCPLFEPFLEWLWARTPFDFDTLPARIKITGVELRMYGYRRAGLGPSAEEAEALGFTVDRHCYPWVAYKGPRFSPFETMKIATPAT